MEDWWVPWVYLKRFDSQAYSSKWAKVHKDHTPWPDLPRIFVLPDAFFVLSGQGMGPGNGSTVRAASSLGGQTSPPMLVLSPSRCWSIPRKHGALCMAWFPMAGIRLLLATTAPHHPLVTLASLPPPPPPATSVHCATLFRSPATNVFYWDYFRTGSLAAPACKIENIFWTPRVDMKLHCGTAISSGGGGYNFVVIKGFTKMAKTRDFGTDFF